MPIFRFSDLPPELQVRVSKFRTVNRLGLPTTSLNRRLAALFASPATIAVRAVGHFGSPSLALTREAARCPADLRVVRALLVSPAGRTTAISLRSLYHAARTGQAALAALLLDHGAPLADYVLAVAARHGRTEVGTLLLDRGVDVHAGQTLPSSKHATARDLTWSASYWTARTQTPGRARPRS